jgi:hypothetical protein
MTPQDAKIGMKVKVDGGDTIYTIVKSIDKWTVELEYTKNGKTWSGGWMDVSMLKEVK